MSTVIQLPERPSLEQLKKLARERARDEGLKLTEAQLRIARDHGFASWPKLKAHVEMVTELTRLPDEVPSDDFLALACLTYGEDSPARTKQAAEMLVADPSLATRDVWSAAACARADALSVPELASTQGGPFDWEPLMYLCYARLPVGEDEVLATATALLDAGADPNVGYLWHGLPTPFTALTGVLGSGEGDQPPHPHWNALARLLLERGANANDAQGLYNRQFRANNEHFELLFEFGLGQGDGGPWKHRLGEQMESPTQMVQHQLRWAIHHQMVARVRLFAERGVDLHSPFDEHPAWANLAAGRTPAEFAAVYGHDYIVDELSRHGALVPPLSPVDDFVAGLLGYGDAIRSEVVPAAVRAQAMRERPSLVVQAAASGRRFAVTNTVAAGFDINALGRADAPCEQPWQTALHTAVERDDAEMVRLLLELGADPLIEDARFHSTPLGWAEHFGHDDIAALLRSAV